MTDFFAHPIVTASFGGAVGAIVGVILNRWLLEQSKKSKKKPATSKRWVRTRVFFLAVLGAAVFLGTKYWWEARQAPSGVAAWRPAGGLPAADAPECRPSGYLIGLLVTPTKGQGQLEGEVDECELMTAMGGDGAWGVGFRPLVEAEHPDPSQIIVRVDAFKVTDPHDSQMAAYISSLHLRKEEQGTVPVPVPDEGSVVVQVTSIEKPNRAP